MNVISNNANPETRYTAVLDMLEPEATYVLTEAESQKTQCYTGEQLAAGLPLELPKRSGLLLFIQRI